VASVNDEVMLKTLEITQMIRNSGHSALTDMMGRSLSKQFEYADKKDISYVIIIGPQELKEESVTIRNMKTGEQELVKINKIINFLEKTS
jgi:histidyl-tRNA synthetase